MLNAVMATELNDYEMRNVRPVDAVDDIRKAAEHAAVNLYDRFEVRLMVPMVLNSCQVVVEMQIPEKIVDTFSIGPHLRGISSYLLKYCGNKYTDAVVGKRLLDYTVIPAPESDENQYSMTDRLRAISDFARLLENADKESLDKIGRIIEILKS